MTTSHLMTGKCHLWKSHLGLLAIKYNLSQRNENVQPNIRTTPKYIILGL
jgi:hypothetical protein